jgi:hypothetical protein
MVYLSSPRDGGEQSANLMHQDGAHPDHVAAAGLLGQVKPPLPRGALGAAMRTRARRSSMPPLEHEGTSAETGSDAGGFGLGTAYQTCQRCRRCA